MLSILVSTFAADGVMVMGLDDTIERRWGKRIAARGIYRDPVRSSQEHFVKTSGLRWLSLMVNFGTESALAITESFLLS